ncbi:hypothetical protein L596_026453 [Steinernema carpocapsae]|uniref:F-box domain-containing protein n=1 Tax=Steinernema carpocapsae TaxID=34508 RepID=A0A4U5M1F2_STECR|nr:hypothetical protein L596_026453 [Steinernema carpocapsae]
MSKPLSAEILLSILEYADLPTALYFRRISQRCRNLVDHVMQKKKMISVEVLVGQTTEDRFVMRRSGYLFAEHTESTIAESYRFTLKSVLSWPSFVTLDSLNLALAENIPEARLKEILAIFESDVGKRLSGFSLSHGLFDVPFEDELSGVEVRMLQKLKNYPLTRIRVEQGNSRSSNTNDVSSILDLIQSRSGHLEELHLTGPFPMFTLQHFYNNPLCIYSSLRSVLQTYSSDVVEALLSLIEVTCMT